MTTRHLLEGLMQKTGARNHSHCAVILGLTPCMISRLNSGDRAGLRMYTLDIIQQKTGVPFDTLFAWYRLPPGAVLGRVVNLLEAA
jgi:transcriptional regulator with XRE-family HTH domain